MIILHRSQLAIFFTTSILNLDLPPISFTFFFLCKKKKKEGKNIILKTKFVVPKKETLI